MSTTKTLTNLDTPVTNTSSAFASTQPTAVQYALKSTNGHTNAYLGQYIIDWVNNQHKYGLTYEDIQNRLFTKIGTTYFENHNLNDRFSIFHEKGDGKDYEMIWEGRISSTAYDKTGANFTSVQNLVDVKTAYCKEQVKQEYSVTIYDEHFERCFNNVSTFSHFIAEKLNALSDSVARDNYIKSKEMLASIDFSKGNMTYQVPQIGTNKALEKLLRTIKIASCDMTFNRDDLCEAEVDAVTPIQDQILILNKDLKAFIDVDVLSGIFNIDKIDIANRVIWVDDFGSLSNCAGILMHKDKYKVFDNVQRTQTFYNPRGLFTNYYYHLWQTQLINPFKQAVKFEFTTQQTQTSDTTTP